MRRFTALAAAVSLSLAVSACAGDSQEEPASRAPVGQAPESPGQEAGDTAAATVEEFTVTERGAFNEGWAMSFLPGTRHLLISERHGALQLRDQETGEVDQVSGVPEVHHAGQAGMHDVIPGPTFADDGAVYLSWVRDHPDGAQGVVGRGRFDIATASLTELEVIWEQTPASGDGHFALRMLIQDDHLYLTSGDRQEFTPAQETGNNLGAVLRLTLDGAPASDNPWAGDGDVASELWTIGHRNPLGIAEDSAGDLWVSEMGPWGGDELNHLVAGENYGWPEASMGVNYSGTDIPDHRDGDGFRAPAEYWVPSMSPGSLLIYQGDLFAGWRGNALLGGLSGENLVRVQLNGEEAVVVDEWDMGERVRALTEAPDGAIWLLEDGPGGRLLELRPV